MLQIDFLATQAHYIDHIAPIWDALSDDNVGSFFVPQHLFGYAQSKLKHHLYLYSYENNSLVTFGMNPILVCAYGDMKYCHRVNPDRQIFMMEHGTGHAFGTSAYPNGPGDRDVVSLFLPPNQYTANKIHEARSTLCVPIGTPKLDWVVNFNETITRRAKPLVCISFHHGTKNRKPPEASSAFEHYKDCIKALKHHPEFDLVAHGHPLSRVRDIPFYDSIGVQFIHDFDTVMRTVDIYVNDLSSTLYEFITTGKPVVVMNAPWFRRNVHHGLRFWDYSDVGLHANEPDELLPAILETIHNPQIRGQERTDAVVNLFPYLGHSAQKAAEVIREHLSEAENV